MSTPRFDRLLAYDRAVQSAASFEDLLLTTQAEIRDVLGYNHAWLMLAVGHDAPSFRLLDYEGARGHAVWEVAPLLPIAGDAYLEAVFRADGPIVVDDARTDPRTNKVIIEKIGNRTIVNVPARRLDGPLVVLGTGSFGDEGVRPPTREALEYLVAMTGSLALAAGRLVLERERRGESLPSPPLAREHALAKSAARLQLLAESSREFASTMDVQGLIDRVAKTIGSSVGESCVVRLLERKHGSVLGEAAAAYHPDPAIVKVLRKLMATSPMRMGEGLTGRVAASGETMLVPRVETAQILAQTPPDLRGLLAKVKPSTVLAIPLKARGRVIGVVTASRDVGDATESAFDKDDVELAQDLADRAALAIESAILVDELRTKSEALARSEARFRRLYDSGIIGITLSDPTGVIIAANDAFLSTFGYTREELERGLVHGRALNTPERDLTDAKPLADLASLGAAHPWEKELLRKDGTRVPVLVGAATLEGTTGERIAFVLDLSEQKKAERRAAEAEALRRSKEAAEEANAELEAFSYSVAHDLRAPLRAINGFSVAVLEDAGDKLDASSKASLQRVIAAAVRMAELIDALLSLSRLSRTEPRREAIDLVDIAKRTVEQLRVSDPNRSFDLVVPEHLPVTGDPELLRAALDNLLANAWKFTSKKERGVVEVGAQVVDGESSFYVRDNGAGFDMTHAKNLFAPFRRLHSPSEFEGTGIGLATVDRIIRRHGGRIWADATVGRGATFHFTLSGAKRNVRS